MTPDTTATMLASRLAAVLPTARWFAGKGSSIERVSLHDRVTVPGDDCLALAVADVFVAGQDASHRYAVALGTDAADAAATPAFLHWLIDTALAGRSVAGRAGRFVGHRVPATAPAAALPGTAADTTVTPIGGDASNSSFVVRCGTMSVIVKLLRRCRPGIQPEVEIGEFLTAQARWQGTPRLRGWLEYAADPPNGESTAIATVHDHAPGCTTAWEKLVGLLEAGGLAGPSAAAATTIAANLGRATAEMHLALASRADIPAFTPQPATAAGRRATADRMADHARSVRQAIESRLPGLQPAIAARLRAVLAAWPTLTDRFHVIADTTDIASPAGPAHDIRVHGDYHLGQVLVGEHDDRVLVIDFEGEPGRPLEERRRTMAAAKDVAGMCRSFDYLLRHVAKTSGGRYDAADLHRLETAYLDGYRAVADGQPWWPAHRRDADALLAAFTLDKAIYELAYELDNRPDWIDVPLAALEQAVAG